MVRDYKRKTVERWTKDDLYNAVVAIKSGQMKISAAAKAYGMARATLYRNLKRYLMAGAPNDPNFFKSDGNNKVRILTNAEERVLADTVIGLRKDGKSVQGEQIRQICYEYCKSNGIQNFDEEKKMASRDWYYGFVKRHPEVRGRRGRPPTAAGNKTKAPVDGEAVVAAGTEAGVEETVVNIYVMPMENREEEEDDGYEAKRRKKDDEESEEEEVATCQSQVEGESKGQN